MRQPYLKTLNMSEQGHIRHITVGFVGNHNQVHFRLNKYGITSIKGTFSKNYTDLDQDAHYLSANELVTKTTGKTRWFPRSNAGVPCREEALA